MVEGLSKGEEFMGMGGRVDEFQLRMIMEVKFVREGRIELLEFRYK